MVDQQVRTATVRIDHDEYIELRFTEASRKAVDDLLAHLLDIVASHGAGDDVRLFINNHDLRRGQPITYLLSQLKAHKRHFDVPFHIRIAANFNMMPIAQLLELFLRTLYSNKIAFKPFMVTDNEGALNWLLAD